MLKLPVIPRLGRITPPGQATVKNYIRLSYRTSRVRAGVFRWLGSVKPSVPPPGTMLCYVRGRRQGRGSVREGVAAAAAKFRTSSTRIKATTPTQLMESAALCKQGCRCEVGAQEEQQLRR